MSRAPFLRTQKAGGVYIKPRVLSSFPPFGLPVLPLKLFKGGSVPRRSLSDKEERFIKRYFLEKKRKAEPRARHFPPQKSKIKGVFVTNKFVQLTAQNPLFCRYRLPLNSSNG